MDAGCAGLARCGHQARSCAHAPHPAPRPPHLPRCVSLGPQGVTFACVNAALPGEEAKGGDESAPAPAPHLATFALRIKAPELLDQFVAAVNEHKAGGKKEAGA